MESYGLIHLALTPEIRSFSLYMRRSGLPLADLNFADVALSVKPDIKPSNPPSLDSKTPRRSRRRRRRRRRRFSFTLGSPAMRAMVPAKSPEYQFQWGPSQSTFISTSATNDYQSPSKLPLDFSPPLIAMVVVIATAFLIVTYSRLISRHLLPPFLRLLRRWRRWHRRRRRRRSHLPSSSGEIESPVYNGSFDHTDAYQVFSPYGLDESVIKTIPLSLYTGKGFNKHGFVEDSRDCAVCLLEFEDNDCVRVLPVCSHAFHVDCIDIWLRSHANCPLCRAGIFRHESPFIPVMAARIRPSLDDAILESILLEPLSEAPPESETTATEIVPAEPSPRRNQSEDRFTARDFLLKRSYSFGFERNFPSERLVMEPATASPWRYRRGSFWSKRPSPFGSLTKSRVFSFRYYRGMKSPFFRRRGGFFPLSESHARSAGGGSSRRTKSLTSPVFIRSSTTASASSRLRCRDLEALLSPERFNRR